MLNINEVTISTETGPSVILEQDFRPTIDRLAKGSRIPAVAAVHLGAAASAVLNSVAGDPDDADAPGAAAQVTANARQPNAPDRSGAFFVVAG